MLFWETLDPAEAEPGKALLVPASHLAGRSTARERAGEEEGKEGKEGKAERAGGPAHGSASPRAERSPGRCRPVPRDARGRRRRRRRPCYRAPHLASRPGSRQRRRPRRWGRARRSPPAAGRARGGRAGSGTAGPPRTARRGRTAGTAPRSPLRWKPGERRAASRAPGAPSAKTAAHLALPAERPQHTAREAQLKFVKLQSQPIPGARC